MSKGQHPNGKQSERSLEQQNQSLQNEQSSSNMHTQEEKKTKGPNRPST